MNQSMLVHLSIGSLNGGILGYFIYTNSFLGVEAYAVGLLLYNLFSKIEEINLQIKIVKFYSGILVKLQEAYNIPRWHIFKLIDESKKENLV